MLFSCSKEWDKALFALEYSKGDFLGFSPIIIRWLPHQPDRFSVSFLASLRNPDSWVPKSRVKEKIFWYMPHLLNSRLPRSLTKDSKIPTLNSQPLVQTALYLLWMMSALNVSFISGNAMKLEAWISFLLMGHRICKSVRNIHHLEEMLYPLSYLSGKTPLFHCT